MSVVQVRGVAWQESKWDGRRERIGNMTTPGSGSRSSFAGKSVRHSYRSSSNGLQNYKMQSDPSNDSKLLQGATVVTCWTSVISLLQ